MKPEEFGPFLTDLRKENNLTQSELAEKLYVSKSAVSKWERGLCLPEITKLEDIAAVFGLTLMEVMQCRKHSPADKEYAKEDVQNAISSVIRISSGEKKKSRKQVRFLSICLVTTILLVLLSQPFVYPIRNWAMAKGWKKASSLEAFPTESPLSASEKLALFRYYTEGVSADSFSGEFPFVYETASEDGRFFITAYRENGRILARYELLDTTRGLCYILHTEPAPDLSNIKHISAEDMVQCKVYDLAQWSRETEWTEYQSFWVFLQSLK